jgi:hypothetical protein
MSKRTIDEISPDVEDDIEVIQLNPQGVDLKSVENPNSTPEPPTKQRKVETEGDTPEEQQPEEPAPPTESEIAKRRELLRVVKYYQKNLGHKLTTEFDIDFSNVKNMTIKELEDMLEEIRICLCCVQTNAFWKRTFFMAVDATEHWSRQGVFGSNIDLTGISNDCKFDPELKDLIDEVIIEHAKWSMIRPENRLMFDLASKLYYRASVNRSVKQITPKLVPPELVEKYKDL